MFHTLKIVARIGYNANITQRTNEWNLQRLFRDGEGITSLISHIGWRTVCLSEDINPKEISNKQDINRRDHSLFSLLSYTSGCAREERRSFAMSMYSTWFFCSPGDSRRVEE